MKLRHFCHFHIAGFTYYEGAMAFSKLKIGTNLKLVFDPDNKYDPKAVALYYKDFKLGYIPRSHNREVSILLETGYDIFEARIQQIDATANPEQQVGVIVFIKHRNAE